jgi:hypothetical protein
VAVHRNYQKIEELGGGRAGDTEQKRDRDDQRDQRAAFGEYAEKDLRFRHGGSVAKDRIAIAINAGLPDMIHEHIAAQESCLCEAAPAG